MLLMLCRNPFWEVRCYACCVEMQFWRSNNVGIIVVVLVVVVSIVAVVAQTGVSFYQILCQVQLEIGNPIAPLWQNQNVDCSILGTPSIRIRLFSRFFFEKKTKRNPTMVPKCIACPQS